MSAPPRSHEREEQRRLNLRTLAIASLASATAAIVTSQFWKGGTPIAAAVTPVIVALVSEMLHRPTEAIARRITSEGPALEPDPDAPLLRKDPVSPRDTAREMPRRESPSEPPVKVYGRKPERPARRKIAVGVVATTAVLAFVIAAAALTVPELITGHSITGRDRNTTLVPTKRKKSKSTEEQQTTPTTPAQTETQTTPAEKQQSTTPAQTGTQTETTTTETQTTPKSP